MNKSLILIILTVFIYGCSQTIDTTVNNEPVVENVEQQTTNEQEEVQINSQSFDWRESELKDIRTGETFKINDFKGQVVLIESFAVWCPTCTRQQLEVKELHKEVGDSVVSIALNTDPNEDESKVKSHIDKNGFDWYYAISSIDTTQSLIDEFGVSIVNAPSAPMVLVCEDGNAHFLDRGLKDVDELQSEIATKCSA